MGFLRLSLCNNYDHRGGNRLPGLTLSVDNASQGYFLYRGAEAFAADRPRTITFVRDNSAESTNSIYTIPDGTKDYFHFYFASTDDLGEDIEVDCNDTDIINNILQARMDTGVVIVIEDANDFMRYRPSSFPAPIASYTSTQLTINTEGCFTFELSSVPSNQEQMVYVFAYKHENWAKYRLQAGICTQNDLRFPSELVVKRIGIEFFTDNNSDTSITSNAGMEMKVFALTLTQVPLCWRYLLPYFASSWATALYDCQ